MKLQKRDILILLGYAVPWVFLGMYGDYAFFSVLPYVLTLAAVLALGWYCGRTKRILILLIGNLLSLLTAWLCLKYIATEHWNYYFKAFPVTIRLVQFWCGYFAVQWVPWWLRKITE